MTKLAEVEKRFSLPFFVWYILPGMNFVTINVVFPIFAYRPSLLSEIVQPGYLALLLAVSLVVGFVMDSLKLYRFAFAYQKSRESFFKRLGHSLGVSESRAIHIFEFIRSMAKESGAYGEFIEVNHARWVMTSITKICLYAAAVEASFMLVYHWNSPPPYVFFGLLIAKEPIRAMIVDAFIVSLLLGLSVRFSVISRDHLRTSNELYFAFAARRQAAIREEFSLAPHVGRGASFVLENFLHHQERAWDYLIEIWRNLLLIVGLGVAGIVLRILAVSFPWLILVWSVVSLLCTRQMVLVFSQRILALRAKDWELRLSRDLVGKVRRGSGLALSFYFATAAAALEFASLNLTSVMLGFQIDIRASYGIGFVSLFYLFDLIVLIVIWKRVWLRKGWVVAY